MSDFIKMEPDLLKGAIQSLLEGKRHARDLENFIDAVLPLVEDPIRKGELEVVRNNAASAAFVLQELYRNNARAAFGQ